MRTPESCSAQQTVEDQASARMEREDMAGEELRGDEPTIFSAWMPFRKDGAPVIAGFGSTTRPVIIIDMGTWKHLCARIPELGATRFRVGAE
jgi:hypothetical protein